jgi:hypothetical protein
VTRKSAILASSLTNLSYKLVAIVFALLFVLMLTVSGCISDTTALAGTSARPQNVLPLLGTPVPDISILIGQLQKDRSTALNAQAQAQMHKMQQRSQVPAPEALA